LHKNNLFCTFERVYHGSITDGIQWLYIVAVSYKYWRSLGNCICFPTNQKKYLHQPSWRTTQQHCKAIWSEKYGGNHTGQNLIPSLQICHSSQNRFEVYVEQMILSISDGLFHSLILPLIFYRLRISIILCPLLLLIHMLLLHCCGPIMLHSV
jgi:hypothetical protein